MWLMLAVVALLLVAGGGDPTLGIEQLLAGITRGARVTSSTYDPDTRAVLERPADLASDAGTDLDTYSLARMIASENGRDSNLIQTAVAWAAANYAEGEGMSISDVLILGGHYGDQVRNHYASTRLDPYEGHVAIAEGVLDGTIPDPTGGATNFDAPRGLSDPDAVALKRARVGLVQASIPGIDPTYMRFWRPG
jgi:hypothetical protein